MANIFDNVETAFAASVAGRTMPRWQRKAMECRSNMAAGTAGSAPAPLAAANAASCSASPRKDADRFIPNRAVMNMEASHFNLMAGSTNVEEEDVTASPSKLEYQRRMRSNLMQEAASSKILAFKEKAPQPKEGFQSDLRVLYTQNKAATRTKGASRLIPQTPDRILDAPELRADYYLNLIDWSSQNMIAVALGEAVYLWNAGSGEIVELCHTENPGDYISSVSWAFDGAHLAVGTRDATVQIWDVTAQRKLRTMEGHGARVGSMDWNQHILSSGAQNGLIMNSDVRVQAHKVNELMGHTQDVCGLKWSPDGRFLASGGNDNLLNIWSAEGKRNHVLTDHQAAVKALAWCPWQSNLLASGGGTADKHIRFWNTTTGNCVNAVDTKSQVCSLLWNKEHHELISGHGFSNNQLTIWKYPTMSKVAELTGHTERVLSMAMSPDGQTVVSAAGDETLRFWKCFASDAASKAKKQADATSARLSSIIR